MLHKNIKTFRYTALTLKFLERFLTTKFNVEGIENVPNQPTLFVANHFTRSETFIVPYLIYKHANRQVRCLADGGLFRGILGRFLKSVGTISTKDDRRNDIIIADLITGRYDWMIYPEGAMIKSKEIYNQDRFITHTPHRIGHTRTGSAVLALKSELYRKDLVNAKKKNRDDLLKEYKQKYNIEYDPKLEEIDTYIVPVNITYYPIRPGSNLIKRVASKIFKALPNELAEELEIEGNLIISADVNICFGKAINISDYVKTIRGLIYQIPIIKNESKVDLILKYLKYRLTRKFMEVIYSSTKINIDHIFAAILYSYNDEKIEIDHLKRLVYLSAILIRKSGRYRVNPHLEEENLYKIFIDESHKEFDNIVNLAKSLALIKESDDKKTYLIDKEKLNKKHQFHQIRLENTLQVMVNEFLLLDIAGMIIRQNIAMGFEKLRQKVFEKLCARDLDNFDKDYKNYYDLKLSKLKSVGAPFFLNNKNISKNDGQDDCGILIIHGYLSAPKEVEKLALSMNELGFKTYAVRLKGHGTAPINLKDTHWQDWYDSVQIGYAALKMVCSKIIIIGFSTGGLLALLSAARKNNHPIINAIIVINSALKLKDIRSKLVPGINIWNDLLEKFKIERGRLEYIYNNSHDPEINYSQNYLIGVEQLEILMDKCEEQLGDVSVPTLIIHSKNDPVIDPKGSIIINQNIKSEIKELVEIDSDEHIIIIGKYEMKVFGEIKAFLARLRLL